MDAMKRRMRRVLRRVAAGLVVAALFVAASGMLLPKECAGAFRAETENVGTAIAQMDENRAVAEDSEAEPKRAENGETGAASKLAAERDPTQPTISLSSGGVYEGSVKVDATAGGMTLGEDDGSGGQKNAVLFNNGSTVSVVGKHVLAWTYESDTETVITQFIRFTVKESDLWKGKKEYNGKASFVNTSAMPYVIDEGKGKPCEAVISNGETLDYLVVGNHRLKVKGMGGYENTYPFVVKETLEFVGPLVEEDAKYGKIFADPADKDFLIRCENAAKLVLNEDPNDPKDYSYQSGTPIKKAGCNTLVVHGADGYQSTTKFVILPDLKLLPKDLEISCQSLGIQIPNCTLQLDQTNYISGTRITEVGYHQLMYAVGGYVKTLRILVKPRPCFNPNQSFEGELPKASVPNKLDEGLLDIWIDGSVYDKKKAYTKIGYHTLTLVGRDDYRYVVNFVIEPRPEDLINDGTVFRDVFWIKKLDAKMTLNGKEINADGITVDKAGEYTLVIRGTDVGELQYVKTITFRLENMNTSLILYICIPVGVVVFGALIAALVMRRRMTQ